MSNDLVPKDGEILPDVVPIEQDTSVQKDLEYARGNMLTVIETARTAMEEFAELARSSENSLAYERFGNFLKQFSEMNKDFIAITERKHELGKPKEESTAPGNVTNQVFVGSPSELSDFLNLKNNGTKS